MGEKIKVTIKEIKELCMQVFRKYNLSEKQGETVFDEYLDAELRGRQCHGFSAFKKFGVKALKAKIGDPKIVKDAPSYTLINGMGNLGQLVCKDAMELTIRKAKKNGIVITGIRNMHAYLMPGTYARMAAEKDMIAFIFNYGGAPRIAPFGSIDPIFGTNPIAIGIPNKDFPIVVDMASSVRAMGLIRLAEKLGEKLESKWALDKDGNPTDDPKKAMQGAVLPFGSYKGSALALVVEIMSRPLLDVAGNDSVNKPGRGFVFLVIDPSIFTDIKKFKREVAELVKKVKSGRKADGVDEIFVPGEHDERMKQENLKKGYLEMDKVIIDEIKGMVK